jgi:DNA-binding NarL/FixJ family response regulator
MLSPMDGSSDGVPVDAPARIKVLLVDDHAVVRRGLHGFFELLDDIEVVGEAEDGRRAVELVAELQPDVVLMDLVMPNMDGVDATRASQPRHARHHPPRSSRRTGYRRPEAGRQYLLKDADADDVAVAIRQACRRGASIRRSRACWPTGSGRGSHAHTSLTDRER